MKISTRLNISAGLSLLFISAFFIFLIHSSHNMNRELEKSIVANNLVQESANLILLTNDYMMHNNERTLKQWQIVYNNINKTLEQNRELFALSPINNEMNLLHGYFQRLISEYSLRDKLLTKNEKPLEIKKNKYRHYHALGSDAGKFTGYSHDGIPNEKRD